MGQTKNFKGGGRSSQAPSLDAALFSVVAPQTDMGTKIEKSLEILSNSIS